MVGEHLDDLMQFDILTPEPGQYQWIQFNEDINLNDFEKIHSGGSSDSYILQSLVHPNVCMRVKREDFFRSLLAKQSDELLINARALVARMGPELPEGGNGNCKVKGLPVDIDPSKPPKSYKEALRRSDKERWLEAYDKEYQGFVQHGTLKIERPPLGLGTTTRTEYKVVNGVFQKCKARLCAMGNQQKEGVHYKAGELYAQVMKNTEVQTFLAIAAKH